MRIVAGTLRGRRLAAPPGTTTRPTIDRVRESLFSSLVSLAGQELGGGAVLDAFAGSGALGFEALSRGAGPVTFVELDRSALSALRSNASSLGVDAMSVIRQADVFSLAERGVGGPFALILLDPPYTLDAVRVSDLLATMAGNDMVADGALVTWEHAAGTPIDWPEHYAELVSKKYGTTAVNIARYSRRGRGV